MGCSRDASSSTTAHEGDCITLVVGTFQVAFCAFVAAAPSLAAPSVPFFPRHICYNTRLNKVYFLMLPLVNKPWLHSLCENGLESARFTPFRSHPVTPFLSDCPLRGHTAFSLFVPTESFLIRIIYFLLCMLCTISLIILGESAQASEK